MKITDDRTRNAYEKELEEILETPFCDFDDWQRDEYEFIVNALDEYGWSNHGPGLDADYLNQLRSI